MVAVARSSGRTTRLEAGGPNAIAVTNGIVGDEWTLWIVRQALSLGFTRYNEWLDAGPISSAVLTARLSRLVDTKVMERVAYQDHPVRFDYRLTRRGREMWAILVLMWAWERQWGDGGGDALPQMRHSECGRMFSPQLVCGACDQPVGVHDVTARFGPSGSWERSIPSATTRRRSHKGARPPESISQAMSLVGNRWSVALLGASFLGSHRFVDFERRMGAPPTIVSERLGTFCDLGVLEHRADAGSYHLTPKGHAFYPVIAAVVEWGQRWFKAPEGPALLTTHGSCGRALHPRLRCDRCDGRLHGAAVEIVHR